MYDRSGLIRRCLVGSGVMSEDVYYHLFFRTGLFPSQRVVDDYIENEYRYMIEQQYRYMETKGNTDE